MDDLDAQPRAVFSLYVITHRESSKRYFGITGRVPEERYKEHIWTATAKSGKKRKDKIHKALEKHGIHAFDFDVLFTLPSHEEACLAEQLFIAKYQNTDRRYGYNITIGGEYVILNEEANKRRAESQKASWARDPARRLLFAELMRRRVPRPITEETRRRLSESHKGHVHTDEHKARITAGLLRNAAEKRRLNPPVQKVKPPRLLGRCYRPDITVTMVLELKSLGLSNRKVGKRLGVSHGLIADRLEQHRRSQKAPDAFAVVQPICKTEERE